MACGDLHAGKVFDVAIIGAGVTGCALAREFALGAKSVVLLERGIDILSGASKANSGLLHTGYDADAGSVELACIKEGRRIYLAVKHELNLPLLRTSALMVAWTEDELERLPQLLDHGQRNDIDDLLLLDRQALRRRAPWLHDRALGALLISGEDVIDPWSAPLAYALQAVLHGAVIERRCEVRDGVLQGAAWRLDTNRGAIDAQVVINAAGLYGDLVEAIAHPPGFCIKPRKGQFVVFDKSARRVVDTVVLPVPSATTKGVLLAPTVFGNVLVGPTAQDQDDREDTSVDQNTLNSLLERARVMVPALGQHAVTATFAGLRPATQFRDFQLEVRAEQHWITVAGIRSTGLTAALGIAARVGRLYERAFGPLERSAAPAATPVPNLAEHRARPYRLGGSGEIVCHCEWVTRGEIEGAVSGPLPARSLGGLSRRTRCMLGRCQGFYCTGRILELVGSKLSWPGTDAQRAA